MIKPNPVRIPADVVNSTMADAVIHEMPCPHSPSGHQWIGSVDRNTTYPQLIDVLLPLATQGKKVIVTTCSESGERELRQTAFLIWSLGIGTDD